MSEGLNFADIRLGISLLFKPGQLVEFRVSTASGGWRGFYYDDHDRLSETAAKLDDDPRVVALYYVINPVKPSLIRLRRECQCKKCKGGGLIVLNPDTAQVEQILTGPTQHLTNDEDIDMLQNMLIDFDTIRAPHLKLDEATKAEFQRLQHESATAEEKKCTREVANKALAYLDAKGWPAALLADSGNGYHVIPRVAISNTSHNTNMLLDVRKALAARFNTECVKIDASTSNASRLTRAYGTMTRKGTSTHERPYRRNRMIQPTQPIQEVPLDSLYLIAAECPSTLQKTGSENSDYPVCRSQWLEEHGVEHICEWGEPFVTLTDVYGDNGDTHYVITPCPGHSDEDLHEHTGKDAERHSEIILYADGGIGFSCWSGDLKIGDVIAKLEKLKGEKYPYRIFEQEAFDPKLIEGFAEQADQDVGNRDSDENLAFATLEEAKAAGQEFNNKGRRCRVCRIGVVGGALDMKCASCKVDEKFVVENGRFEMVRANDNGVVRQIVGVNASMIKPKPIEWLWPDKIPANAITWLYGAQGSAKSAVTCEIASIVSTGRDFPDGTKNEMGAAPRAHVQRRGRHRTHHRAPLNGDGC
jgi:AAA domain